MPIKLPKSDNKENYLYQSEDVTPSAFWSPIAVTVTANAVLDYITNTNVMDRIQETTATSNHAVFQTVDTIIPNEKYIFTVDVKADGKNTFALYVSGPSYVSAIYAFFDLTGGTITNSLNCAATILGYSGGFYRVGIAFVTPDSAALLQTSFAIYLTNGSTYPGSLTYAGNTSNRIAVNRVQVRHEKASSVYCATTTQPRYSRIRDHVVKGQNGDYWARYANSQVKDFDSIIFDVVENSPNDQINIAPEPIIKISI